MMGNKLMLWTAALAFAFGSTAALANVVVVKSRGPSAKAYPPGKTLNATAKITLQGGDVVTLLGPSAAKTLRGPGNFDAAQVDLVSASGQRGRFSALRNAKLPKRPSVWDIDVTQTGKICVANAAKLQLWRPDSDDAATVEIRGTDGRMEKLSFAKGKALAAWPASLPVKSGVRYEISWPERNEKSSLDIATVKSAPLDQVATAQLLMQNGCENQLDLLIANAEKDSD